MIILLSLSKVRLNLYLYGIGVLVLAEINHKLWFISATAKTPLQSITDPVQSKPDRGTAKLSVKI